MAEDYTTYTETDPSSHLSVAAAKITVSSMSSDETAYVYKDKGASYFNGGFTHDFQFKITTGSGAASACLWGVANDLNNLTGLNGASKPGLFVEVDGYASYIYLHELSGGTDYYVQMAGLSVNTTYYCRVIRDVSVGTYGTAYLKVYSDSSRTTQVGTTQSLTLHNGGGNTSFRYIYGVNSNDYNYAGAITCEIENLSLFVNYFIACGQGTFSLTGKDILPIKSLHLPSSVASFILTGNNIINGFGRSIQAIVGSFSLSGKDIGVSKSLHILTQVGSFILTGIDITRNRGYNLSVNSANFIVNTFNAVLGRGFFQFQNKNSSSYTNQNKNVSTWNEESKNSSSWTYQDKN